MRPAFRALVALALIVPGVVLSTSCQRKPRFEPLQADSTALGPDSMMVRAREALSLWESGSPEDAAAASAQVLMDRVRGRPATEWKELADRYLDSLGVGAESVAGDCVLMVNFFPRSDPTSTSWPYLFWCGDEEPQYQAVEGKSLRLFSVASRGFKSKRNAGPPRTRGVGALFGRRAGGGHQPLLMVWSAPPAAERWKLVQTLGPDSLGGTGTGEFETVADTTVELMVRTYRTPGYFEECATCPHVYELHRFRWGAEGFQRVEDSVVPSPYSTFVAFIRAVMANDEDRAEPLVTKGSLFDDARDLDWGKPRGNWRIAPATDETPAQMIFFRGKDEAYRIEFERSGGNWLIAGFEAVPRTVE